MERYLYAVFFPLIHIVALCCDCMITVLPLWHCLIWINSRCIYSFIYSMQMFLKTDAVATVHPQCLSGKIDHFYNYILNLTLVS